MTIASWEYPLIQDLADKTYIYCLREGAGSLNELLEVFNTALRYAGVNASYVQRGEDYAEWIAPDEATAQAAREFYNLLMCCRSGQEVYDLILDFRKNNEPDDDGAIRPGHNED